MKRRNDLLHTAIIFLILFVFLALATGSVIHKSLTYDEPQHFRYGEQILEGNADRFDDSKMPISALNVLASRLARIVLGDRLSDPWHIMSAGRIATILFSAGTAFLMYLWGKELYGKWIGVAGMVVYVFEPNILAHSRLITTDIYATGTITLALYLFWRFLKKPCISRAVLAALVAALCQVVKYSGLFLYPLLFILVIVYFRTPIRELLASGVQHILQPAGKFALYAGMFLLLSVLIINAAFLFDRTAQSLGSYQFTSERMLQIQSIFGFMADFPVPVPYTYLDGLDRVLYNESTGNNFGAIYLLGMLKKGEGFPGYYVIASLLKIPLALQLLFILAAVQYIRKSAKGKVNENLLYLLIPWAYFNIYFNFFFQAQIGIRFLLVIFPVTILFSLSCLQNWEQKSRFSRAGYIALIIYMITSTLSYTPHYLSYFNELILDRKNAYLYLSDSNIEWGQNRAHLAEFLQQNPEYIFEPEKPSSGQILVGVNELTGVLGGPERYAWLRNNFQPDNHLYYTYLIYEISEEELTSTLDMEIIH